MYIHEHENWTDFCWNERTVTPLLGKVRFEQGALLGKVADLGFSISQMTELDTLAEEVLTSSGIEGEMLNAKSVRSSVARQLGIDYESDVSSTRTEEGAVELTLDATKNYEQELSEGRLFGWQAALFPTGYSGLHPVTTGAWRSTGMQVVSGSFQKERVHYEAPSEQRVPELVREFIEWFNSNDDLDGVLKAGVAHLWFLAIHPFDDGNGRIARALTELLLARSDRSPRRFYSMSSSILERRASYYKVLETTQKGGSDITAWLEWFLNTLLDSIRLSERRLEAVLARASFWNRHEHTVFNNRQRKMLTRLLADFEGKLTAAKWAKMTKTSHDSAVRDINDLIAKDILEREEAGGRSTTYRLTLG